MSESYSADYITSALRADRTERLFVEAAAQHARDGIYVDMGNSYGWLPAAAARDLGAWLAKRYGLAPYADAKPGETVRVLAHRGQVATTAEVVSAPDEDDEYYLKGLGYVHTKHVRHLDAIVVEDATPATTLHAVGTPLIVTHSGPTLHGPKLPVGTPVVVKAHGATGSTYVVSAFIDGAITERRVRAQDVAPTMPAATATLAPTIEVGREYRLLPGARIRNGAGRLSDFGSRVERVTIVRGPDSDGDYYAKPSSGVDGWVGDYVGAKYLAPLDEARPWAVGDEAIVTDGGKYLDGFHTGQRVRLIEVDPFDLTRIRARGVIDGATWYTRTDAIRRP